MMVLRATSPSLPIEGRPLEPDPFQQNWTILLFLLLFALIAWVRAAYPFRLRLVLDCLRAPRFIRQRVRDEEPFTHPASWALFLVSICTGGLFLYQHHLASDLAFLGEPGLRTFGDCLLIVLIAAFLKLSSLSLLRGLLGMDPGIREYRYHLLLIIEALGLLLLPITLAIAFMSNFLPQWGFIAIYPLMGAALLILLSRAVTIAKGNDIPPFYIFLYLCTLEFLPLIVSIKAFIDHY